jgi:hypothetical protein
MISSMPTVSRVWTTGIASVVFATAAVSRARAEPQSGRPVQVIAVAQFQAPNPARARSAVLETLSDHNDVEVIALEDIVVAGKRVGADPATPAGRLKLSEELQIEAWLDGTIEDGLARFTLHAPDGHVLATASVQGHKANVAEGLAGIKIWEAMGPLLSLRERAKRAVEVQQDLAQKKVKAREQELVRLRQAVVARAAAREKQLKASQALAQQKRSAFVAELDRQATIADQRTAVAERDRKDAERKRADAEEAEFLASLQESGGPPIESEPMPAATAPSRTSAWGAAPAQNAWAASAKEPSAAPLVASASAQPAGNSALSPATQRWLMSQQGAPAAAVPAAAPPARAVPAMAAAPAPAPAVANQDGLSPSTRAWLAQQGQR